MPPGSRCHLPSEGTRPRRSPHALCPDSTASARAVSKPRASARSEPLRGPPSPRPALRERSAPARASGSGGGGAQRAGALCVLCPCARRRPPRAAPLRGGRAGCSEDERRLLEALPAAMQSALAADLNFSVISGVDLFQASASAACARAPRPGSRAVRRVRAGFALGPGERSARGLARSRPAGAPSAEDVVVRAVSLAGQEEGSFRRLGRPSSIPAPLPVTAASRCPLRPGAGDRRMQARPAPCPVLVLGGAAAEGDPDLGKPQTNVRAPSFCCPPLGASLRCV